MFIMQRFSTCWRYARGAALLLFSLLVAFGVTTCWVAALAEQQEIQSPAPTIRCLYGDVLVTADRRRFQMRINELSPVIAMRADSEVVVVACRNDSSFIGLVVIRHYAAELGLPTDSGAATIMGQPYDDGRLH